MIPVDEITRNVSASLMDVMTTVTGSEGTVLGMYCAPIALLST
jgi:hypothetical protein